MKYGVWKRFRANRLAVVFFALILYVTLIFVDINQTFSQSSTLSSLSLPIWISLGFSFFVALIFFAIGSLIWFYSRDRLIALILFVFSCAIMIVFELETASSLSSTNLLNTVVTLDGSFAIVLFALILLFFPKNYITLSKTNLSLHSLHELWNAIRLSPLRRYIFLLFGLFFVRAVIDICTYIVYSPLTLRWRDGTESLITIIALAGSLVTIIVSFRKSTSKEREQLRFFVSGVILAIAPLLLLTVIPQAISFLSPYAIDSQITTLPVILLPLSLGYAILRFQILVFDTYIRRTVNWIIGIIFLAILVYTIAVVGGRLWNATIPFYVIVIAAAMAVLAPITWWLAKILTERVLFKESLRYRRLADKPIDEDNESLDLHKAAQIIIGEVLQTFKTMQVGLFVLIEDTGCYHLFPPLTDTQSDASRHELMTLLTTKLTTTTFAGLDALALQTSVEDRLSASPRPLLLHEVTRSEEDMPVGLDRFLTPENLSQQKNPMLAPIRSQGKMIGLLALGERADKQSYAGPDFEIAQLLLARYSYLLETARLQERSRMHAALLNDLYEASTMSANELPDLETVASTFANVAAQAMNAGVEICLFDKTKQRLRRTKFVGNGTPLSFPDVLQMSHGDWSTYYYSGKHIFPRSSSSLETPPCLDTKPEFPFAWHPLHDGEKYLGILIVTYLRPHLFFDEEIHVLDMFASQCAATLENTKITLELRAAYERQKELDALKDQFIMTASHELRTPLTAVLGYIELLEEYNVTLNADTRAEFIAKAHRGCDELALMVNNIMDANRVQVDASSTKMNPISLAESVDHIVEIFEALSKREQRTITVAVPSTLNVMADIIRLRQILLNLVGNALKYSPQGTNIEISATHNGTFATICVRDYGAGVPLEEQTRLFDRFMRLERDMNSPVRGAGLGLFICKQLVEAMGGTIWVESSGRAGRGSSFFFTLHYVASDVPAVQDFSLR